MGPNQIHGLVLTSCLQVSYDIWNNTVGGLYCGICQYEHSQKNDSYIAQWAVMSPCLSGSASLWWIFSQESVGTSCKILIFLYVF